MQPSVDLSIIVPLYNEAESARALYEAIIREVDPLDLKYEMLFVDDGSRDGTFELIAQLAISDKRLRIVKFRANYGQTPAMVAGFDHARGRVLITMDGDLQNDPADIPKFLDKINEGYDIVVGWRYDRQDKLVSRRIPSKIANWLIGRVTGVPIKDNGCSLKAYRADVIKQIPLYSEMHRFIPAMASLAGARIAEIKVRHHPRRYGMSKYGLSRIYKVLLDLLTIKTLISFTTRPLLWFGMLTLPAILISTVALSISVFEWIVYGERFSVPLAGTGVLFGALAFVLLLSGILGELIYKTGDTKIHELSSLTAKHVSNQP